MIRDIPTKIVMINVRSVESLLWTWQVHCYRINIYFVAAKILCNLNYIFSLYANILKRVLWSITYMTIVHINKPKKRVVVVFLTCTVFIVVLFVVCRWDSIVCIYVYYKRTNKLTFRSLLKEFDFKLIFRSKLAKVRFEGSYRKIIFPDTWRNCLRQILIWCRKHLVM